VAGKGFRSPLRKLVTFFLKSRDKWKAKYHAAKRELRLIHRKHARLRQSRDYWEQRCGEAERQLAQRAGQGADGEALRGGDADAGSAGTMVPAWDAVETRSLSCPQPEDWQLGVARHHYSRKRLGGSRIRKAR